MKEQVGAHLGLNELLRIIEDAGLVAYLEHVFPFGAISNPVVAPPMTALRAVEAPLFQSTIRGRYAGRKPS